MIMLTFQEMSKVDYFPFGRLFTYDINHLPVLIFIIAKLRFENYIW